MAKDTCPVCDNPETSVLLLIDRINDPDLLVTLACDFAERTLNMPPYPIATSEWLRTIRDWRDNPQAVQELRRMMAGANSGVEAAFQTAKTAIATIGRRSPAWAIADVKAATRKTAKITGMMGKGSNPDETKWQLEHTKVQACTCLLPRNAHPQDGRSRNSLLAQ